MVTKHTKRRYFLQVLVFQNTCRLIKTHYSSNVDTVTFPTFEIEAHTNPFLSFFPRMFKPVRVTGLAVRV